MGLACDEGAFVGGQINHQGGDFLSSCQSAHGLARDKGFHRFFIITCGGKALVQARAVDRAGANWVAERMPWVM